MRFATLVAAAEARAQQQQRHTLSRSDEIQRQDRSRMDELQQALMKHAADIEALPATLTFAESSVRLCVDRGGRSLQVDVYFDGEILQAYLLAWSVSGHGAHEDGSIKAASPGEAVVSLAEMIGRHFAGIHPAD